MPRRTGAERRGPVSAADYPGSHPKVDIGFIGQFTAVFTDIGRQIRSTFGGSSQSDKFTAEIEATVEPRARQGTRNARQSQQNR